MNIFLKVKNVARLVVKNGFRALIVYMVRHYNLPIHLDRKFVWKAGVKSQIRFWDSWFQTQGLRWPDAYKMRINPNLPLQPRPAALLPPLSHVNILDVGAGPLTVLGKKLNGKQIKINAVDPLADEYDRLLAKYHIQPIVRTQNLQAEELSREIPANTYDLVFASNSIDHSYDPEQSILQMILVTKSGGYILLEHAVNEAENENYSGFHQWNFSVSPYGDFLISSKSDQVNMTKKYASICSIQCEVIDGCTLITRIRKR
jgi:SAM-dependent methyltransferase